MILAPPPAALSHPRDPFASPSTLLARIAHGDAEALGWFFDRWEAPVHAFVARLIRDPDARERVVEAIFWEVWERAASYDSSSVDQWMHTLAIACCRAELDRRLTPRRGAAGRTAVHLRASAALRETSLLPH